MSQFDAKLAAATMTLAAMDGMEPHMDLPVVAAMAGVIALAQCRIQLGTQTDSIAATVATTPDTAGHPIGQALERLVSAQTAARFAGDNAGDIVEALGLDDAASLTIAMIGSGADPQNAVDVFERVGAALRTVNERVSQAITAHVAAVIERDIDVPGVRTHFVTPVMRWALCLDRQGDPSRSERMLRRRQALDAYGAVASKLEDPAATKAIDEGGRLAPVLCASLGITAAQLRTVNGIVTAAEAMNPYQDRVDVIAKLVEYGVATHRWPEEIPNDGWRHHSKHLEPRHTDTSAKRDALDSFTRDIVQPLIQARADARGMATTPALGSLISSVQGKDVPAWRKAIDGALVAGRAVKPYGEAVEKWHRRVASINALRQEHTLPQPGWPALCKPWTSEDGRATITALTTAEALVDEGTMMRHCVGGYYETCRGGETQIFSYAVDGKRHATLEILVKARDRGITIRQGQFEGRGRVDPGETAHGHVDEFIGDLESGKHKANRKAVVEFIEERRAAGYEYDRRTVMGLDFVRRAWPLYLPLMRRDADEDFDAWAAASPLVAAIDAELDRIQQDGQQQLKKAA